MDTRIIITCAKLRMADDFKRTIGLPKDTLVITEDRDLRGVVGNNKFLFYILPETDVYLLEYIKHLVRTRVGIHLIMIDDWE